MRKILYLFPVLLLASILACENHPEASSRPYPVDSTDYAFRTTTAAIFQAPITDTLPPKAVQALSLSHVNGIQVKYLSGKDVYYFAYPADKKTLLRTIANLPFSKYSIVADTLCRKSSHHALTFLQEEISPTEYKNSRSFWEADKEEFEVYECIKSPMRHTLLVSKKSGQVFHRIELV